MGRLVANPEGRPPLEVWAAYEGHLQAALGNPPRSSSIVNVLLHALGYLSKGLSAQEKAYFLDVLAQYRAQRVPMSTAVGILRAWIIRFEEPYLARQHFFAPYPADLVLLGDSGKGREVD